MTEPKTVWEIFGEFSTDAPKNMAQLEEFEKECVIQGYPSVAKYLEKWRTNFEWHLDREWTVDDRNECTDG